MKPYKKVFRESDLFKTQQEVKQIVDISNLEWGDVFESNWDSAQSQCPQGWRLPTIQELYTAYNEGINFKPSDFYWSSSEYSQNHAWSVNFKNGSVNFNVKSYVLYVRCVREINTSYEDKIESLLIKHLKMNYNKSPKEIEAIEFFMSSVLNDLEYTEFTMAEASKLIVICKRFLGTI
jgi:hypothetical protein